MNITIASRIFSDEIYQFFVRGMMKLPIQKKDSAEKMKLKIIDLNTLVFDIDMQEQMNAYQEKWPRISANLAKAVIIYNFSDNLSNPALHLNISDEFELNKDDMNKHIRFILERISHLDNKNTGKGEISFLNFGILYVENLKIVKKVINDSSLNIDISTEFVGFILPPHISHIGLQYFLKKFDEQNKNYANLEGYKTSFNDFVKEKSEEETVIQQYINNTLSEEEKEVNGTINYWRSNPFMFLQTFISKMPEETFNELENRLKQKNDTNKNILEEMIDYKVSVMFEIVLFLVDKYSNPQKKPMMDVDPRIENEKKLRNITILDSEKKKMTCLYAKPITKKYSAFQMMTDSFAFYGSNPMSEMLRKNLECTADPECAEKFDNALGALTFRKMQKNNQNSSQLTESVNEIENKMKELTSVDKQQYMTFLKGLQCLPNTAEKDIGQMQPFTNVMDISLDPKFNDKNSDQQCQELRKNILSKLS